MDFLWTKDIEAPSFKDFSGDKECDVLIIGGGMAGVLCAKKLQEQGVDYMLVEGKNIGGGITKGTTAVLTAQHDVLYKDLIKKFGHDKAKSYLDSNLWAVNKFHELSKKINCDFEERPSFMFSINDKGLMEEEAKAVQSLGFDAEFTTDTPLPYPVLGAVKYNGMAQFHPLKFLYKIASGLNIYENVLVKNIKGTTAITDKGNIRANKIIVATHFPFVDKHGLYFMKLYQQRSYVIAYENAPDLKCTIEDSAENGIYLRNYKDLLLVGGGDHRTGKRGGAYQTIRDYMKKYYPEAREKYSWSNQDCVSLDGLPYIGPYCPLFPNVYVASGFNLWGMTNSMITSEILADMVTGKENPYAEAFNPFRSMMRKQLFKNMGTTICDLIIPSKKRCSHLGCTLKWNPLEHSWDCPCHGSRFEENGKLIDNPALKDIHIK